MVALFVKLLIIFYRKCKSMVPEPGIYIEIPQATWQQRAESNNSVRWENFVFCPSGINCHSDNSLLNPSLIVGDDTNWPAISILKNQDSSDKAGEAAYLSNIYCSYLDLVTFNDCMTMTWSHWSFQCLSVNNA